MSDLLSGLGGVTCMMDDILVYGRTNEEHDNRLQKVLQRIQDAGVTLNTAKCEFAKNTVRFLGHVVDATGIRPDTDKIVAIQNVHHQPVWEM